MTQTSDAELADAFVSRRQDAAFIELVRRYQIPVFRQLELALSDPDDAEAACESVFVVASQRLSEWPRETDLSEWLLELAETIGREHADAPVDTAAPRFVDPAVFFKHSVHRALRELPETDRKLLLAVDLEGQSIEQVAQAAAMPVGRITQSLAEARERFTQAIQSRAPGSGGKGQTARQPLQPGEIIDKRYRLENLLGEGGMAAVFRAEHVNIKRKVALKTLHPTRQTEAMMRERFLREAEVLGRLAHPNFVDVSDFGVTGRGLSYLVMELLNGQSLAAELAEFGPLAPRRALVIVQQLCVGLEHAHGLGIIHRDIKPANIIVTGDESEPGFAKILDLGIATTSGDAELDSAALYGTPEYMAPEQILAQRIDGRVDLYAVGITLFELLTGRVPFSGSSIQFVLAQQLTSQLPRLEDERPDLPEPQAFQALLDSCVAKDADKRVRNAKQLGQAVASLLARLHAGPAMERPPRSLAVSSGTAPLPRDRGRARLLAWACAALGVVLLAWLAYQLLT